MLLIQLAVTAIVVNVVSRTMVSNTIAKAHAEAREKGVAVLEMPVASLLLQSVSFWAAMLLGLAGVWTL